MKITTKKLQMPNPSLRNFFFAPLPKKTILMCLFLRRKEGKSGRYTPIGHSPFPMWLLFYKLTMLETKFRCLCVHGHCMPSVRNPFAQKGHFLCLCFCTKKNGNVDETRPLVTLHLEGGLLFLNWQCLKQRWVLVCACA